MKLFTQIFLLFFSLFYFGQVTAQEEIAEACFQTLQPKLNICGWRMCAFDFNAEFIFLKRDNDFRSIDFSTEEIAGETVLESRDLKLGWAPGWRFTGEIFFDTCDRIEVSYLSMCDWEDAKKVGAIEDNLYSVLSFFGANPFNGFNSTDEASLHKIKYGSDFYTWEVNYRNHLSLFEIPCFCCLDGSIFYGYRHFKLEETFSLETESEINGAEMDYRVKTCNVMQGMQIGAEAWLPLCEWMDVGAEAKGTAYVNCAEQKTSIAAPADLAESPYTEEKDGMTLSWGVEATVRAGFELFPNLYLRTGYFFLYLENVALAVDNFNKKPPFEERRSKKLKINGEVIYHGITMGVDWCW